MSTLIQDCGSIVTAQLVQGCGRDKIEFPRMVVVWNDGVTLTAVGENPTPAELQTAINNGIAFVLRFSNGVLNAPEKIEIAGTDTESGLPEVAKENQSLTGTLRNINNKIRKMLAQMNLNMQIARFGWIGDEGRWHGGTTGYKVPFYVGEFYHAGDGNQLAVDLKFDWKRDFYTFTNYSAQDGDYLTLNNLDMIGTYTVANTVGTSGNEIDSWETITGWDKDLYPILYAEILVLDVLTLYLSDAKRTAGVAWAAKIDLAAGETVTNGNEPGVTFGGSINLISTAIVVGDKFTVTYS
jgi:hypothetical protein